MNLFTELSEISKQLQLGTYTFSEGHSFLLNERGKSRLITAESFRDRVVKHAMCDNILNPEIFRHLIYDNGASQEGKGTAFTRNRLLAHLRKFYQQNKSNDGYILLIDFSKYYDNIRHDKVMELFRKYVEDEYILSLIEQSLKLSEVDVSYLGDEVYTNAMNLVFDSVKYQQVPEYAKTGQKMLRKHINIGDQLSQTVGVMYRIELDNFIKIVKGVKLYGTYMDDSYIIHSDKDYLKELTREIDEKCKQVGIFLNKKKTRIYKLSQPFTFLQVQYSLTESGRVITKINPKQVSRIRKKLIQMRSILYDDEDFENYYKAEFNAFYKLMSRYQRDRIENTYKFLKGELLYNGQ